MSSGNKITKYEDLIVWKRSMELAKEIIQATTDLKLYSLKDQLCRSVISIPSNIAEGYERQSNKEYIRFLYIAKGSCGELRTQLYLLKSLKLVTFSISERFIQESKEISAMLSSLIQTRVEKF
jgi:four helix bundle protein